MTLNDNAIRLVPELQIIVLFLLLIYNSVTQMQNRLLLLILFLWPASAAFSQKQPERPKLVIGIVVDQMRWDYLYRYHDRFSNDGFRRLMEDGFNCENTHINYLPTFTAPGHASIYTGSVPALHGIAANDWIDIATGREWYCCEDTAVTSTGGGKAGLMSPRNLLATTITDELRLATNFQSKTIGIALKDRGAILPAGHSANAAYWYDDSNGHFISSSFYMNQLPQWLVQFNNRNISDSLMLQDWHTLYPIESYRQSTADDNTYEGRLMEGEERPVFPHLTSAAVQSNDKGVIRSTPFGNTLTRLMAEAAIVGAHLGGGAHTDFLALSFSSPDYIGHIFAPNSIEVEDSYLRLDQEIARFLSFLDQKIGKGNYLVFLTADHAGAHNPAFLDDHNIPGESISIRKANQQLNQFLQKEFGDSAIVLSLMNYQVFLNEQLIKDKKLDRDAIRKKIMIWLKAVPGIAFVLDMEHPESNTVPQIMAQMAVNGYHAKRSGSIQIIMEPGWFSGHGSRGTTHGSWNPYDSHIPLLWYGWHIPKGATYRSVAITDIAATLAALLHIQMPNASIGEPVTEIFK